MRVVFMGTPEFSATILSYLVEQHEVIGVFTRPDAVRSRGKKLISSPVKEIALENNIEVIECNSFTKDEEAFGALERFNPELIVVAAFSALLPKRVLELPKYGCINVHASMLPKWRGAAPVERAILAHDEMAGVCIMKMEEGLDTGDYSIERSIEIGTFNASELTAELADLGARALLTCIEQIELGCCSWMKQDESKATYAKKIGKGELNINPNQPVKEVQAHVQASSESHPSKCVIAGKEVTVLKSKIFDSSKESLQIALQKGEIVFLAKRLFVGCADGICEILQVKPNGKNAMDAKSFCAGIQGIKQGGFSWEGING